MLDKITSRKFLFTVFWNALVVFAMFCTIYLKMDLPWIGQVITFAGTCTTVYLGITGYIESKK